jgi:hypothetical protein
MEEAPDPIGKADTDVEAVEVNEVQSLLGRVVFRRLGR